MPEINWVDVLFRWMHVGSFIVMLGGSVFMRFVLMPSAGVLSESDHQALKAGVVGRWKKFVMISIGLLIISGTYNLIRRVKMVSPIWHGLFGLKLLLAILVFFLASALVGRSKGLEPIRQQAAKWLGITIAAGAIVVLLSGILKNIPNKPVPNVDSKAVSVAAM